MCFLPSFCGFNPCFTGYGSDAFVASPQRSLCCRFNPCFTGYGSDAPARAEGAAPDIKVSILVLLDMALMPPLPGSGTARVEAVSILVLLDMALMPLFDLADALHLRRFQSLFYWIWL